MIKTPNPQGKGLVPLLETLLVNRVQANIPAKSIEQIICELFTSQFVLQGEFKFRPVTNRSYWLYRKNNMFRLSMINPQEWRNDRFGQSVGECVMQSDMTWTISLSENARNDREFIDSIESQWIDFNKNLSAPSQLKQAFPIYNTKLPFYQRVLASNLAYSLGVSLDKKLAQIDESELNTLESRSFEMLDFFSKKD